MAKLIVAFCAFLLAVALAAPAVEDTSQPSNVKELIEKADPVENDISAPRTDVPPEKEETPVEGQGKITETIITSLEKVEAPQKQEETPVDAETGKEAAEEIPVEATPSEGETPEDTVGNNENETAEGSPYEGMVPVDEVIPPPKIAFVLGDSEAESNPDDSTKYRVVQGETEEGMPVISEYFPDGPIVDENTDDTVMPIAEETAHDYPHAEIIPEADFNQEAGSGMAEISPFGPEMTSDRTMDYDAPFGDSMPVGTSSNPDYDYPVDSTFVGPLDYPPGFFDDHYDTSADGFMAGPVMNVGLPPVDHPDAPNMEEDTMHNPDMSEMGSGFDNIVAGLEARYHPDPISGRGPYSQDEHLEGPEANYPVYKDQPIIPGAMLNRNLPSAESIHKVDTPVPERVPMDDLSESSAIKPNDAMPDNELVDSNAIAPVAGDNDMTSSDSYGFELDHPVENSNVGGKPDIVIELSLNNQEASVNGRPFDMSQARNILNFIEELISRATFSRRPMMDDMDNHFNAGNEYPSPDTPMNDFTNRNTGPSPQYPLYGDSNFDDSHYPARNRDTGPSPQYPLYGDGNFDDSYHPARNDFDYNPYYPFFNPRFNRGMNPSSFDNMPDNMYHGRFGFEVPSRDRRFAYNPMWF